MISTQVKSYGTGLPDGNIPAAGTVTHADIILGNPEIDYIALQLVLGFTTAGGTTIKLYLQTSFDNGATWWDVICIFGGVATITKAAAIKRGIASAVRTAAVDGTLADDTIFDGFFGSKWRVKQVIAGAYAADNTFKIFVT